MKELTLQEIKTISLNILQDVHSFCVSNQIHYSLGYGTLLGAVRHNGYIPWDDDIDIVMPRPDYERFCRLYTSQKGYEVISNNSDDCYLNYARVCDQKDTIVISPAPWCKKGSGIWIDIFPLDGGYEDPQLQKNQFNKALRLYDELISARFVYKNRYRGLLSFLRYVKTLILRKNINALKKEGNKIIEAVKYGNTLLVQDFSCINDRKMNIFRKACMDEYILLPFEDKVFFCMKGYDEALTCWYNDYMKLPPENQRVCAHSAHKYYWKNK